MKLFISGKGGELCIGKLSEDQEDFVFSNAEDEEIEFDEFWEGNEIMNGAWFDFDDILHSNSVYMDCGRILVQPLWGYMDSAQIRLQPQWGYMDHVHRT